MNQSLNADEFEVIVVNDASTDRTKDILDNYENDVRIFHFEENVGLAAARNFGIKKSKGQFIMFLDADDYLHKDILRTHKLFLEENNDLDAISCDYYLVDDRGRHIKYEHSENAPIACGIMFRKDFLFEIGLYDESFRAREEEDLRIRFEKKYSIYNIKVPLYRYRMHEHNLTKNEKVMSEYHKELKKKHDLY